MEIDLNAMGELIAKGQQLQALLTQNPEMLTFLQLLKDTDTEHIVVPVKADRLIYPGEAREILRVSETTLNQYVDQGLLKSYRTPPKGKRKFWLSEVMAIPQMEH